MHIPRKVSLGRDFVMVFKDHLLSLAANKSLTGDHLRVFLALMSHTDFDNKIEITQKAVAAELGMKPSSFNRTLKGLVAQGVLKTGAKIGNSPTYVLSDTYGWCGTAREYHQQHNFQHAPLVSMTYPPIVPA